MIGASAGGLTAFCTVIRGLPPDPPAAIFVVLHVVEDPEEAVIPEMPKAALGYCDVDCLLPAAKICTTLVVLMKSESKAPVLFALTV